MSESIENLLKINELQDEICNSENFLYYKWDKYSIPVIDVDFLDLFSRLVIDKEVFKFCPELSKEELEKLIEGEVTDRSELVNLKKTLSRVDKLNFEEYLLQNSFAIFKNPEFYINRLNDSSLHTSLNGEDLNNSLNLIYLKNKKILGENGLPNLYLTLGFYSSNNFNAPLIFIPVKLEKNNEDFELSYDSHDIIRLNTSLELKLKEEGIDLPKNVIKSESDMISYLKNVNRLGNIKPFVTLGLFDFTIPIALNDINTFEGSEELNNFLKDSDKTFHFDENEIDLINEIDSYNVLDADSSQISAIREALLSNNLFIDAPAGSKKVDTIVNLISEIIANKKTVLYVSDKLNEIHDIEDKLSQIGFGKLFIDLYGDNYDYPGFLEEIINSSEDVPNFEYDQKHIYSKLNELNQLKRKLSYYSTFINTPYRKLEITPYDLMGMIERNNVDELDNFEMKNLSNLSNGEYKRISRDFIELSEFYSNNIYPVAEHNFNYIVAKDITDNQLNEVIEAIHNIKKDMEDLIKLNNVLNDEFGIKKLEKLNDYKAYFKKLECLENNPQLMGEDYGDLKKQIGALNDFQIKTDDLGSIEELEEKLEDGVYNTHLFLENYFYNLDELYGEINNLTESFDKLKSKILDSGMKNINSFAEFEEIKDYIDLLDKNPTLISDEEEINSFVSDLEKYQDKCREYTPEDLLKNIDDLSKSTLKSTKTQINTLMEYQKSIEEVNRDINDLCDLKNEIGLNEFNSINNIDYNLKNIDVLLSCPKIVDHEDVINDFINLFEKCFDKFGNNDYSDLYSTMNDRINEIQNNISDEISKTSILEIEIPRILSQIKDISAYVDKLSKLLDVKKINSIKEIDEYCDNIEILLENPVIIPKNEKLQIDAYISLLEDIQNKEDYTTLDLWKINDLINKVIEFDNEFKKLNFKYDVFDLDLNNKYQLILGYKERLDKSPINYGLTTAKLNILKKKFDEFSQERKKFGRMAFWSKYNKLKNELKASYAGDPDDEKLYLNYKKYLGNVEKIERDKKTILNYSESNKSMEITKFLDVLHKLTNLQDKYNIIVNELNEVFKVTGFNNNQKDFGNVLEYLSCLKLKLEDIDKLKKNQASNINSKLGKYFKNTYFNLETNLDELYRKYIVNEEYEKLIDNGFFSKDSLDKYVVNKKEVKDILKKLDKFKSNFYYSLNSIRINVEIADDSLDIGSISNVSFTNLKNYFTDLLDDCKIANDLFNNVDDNYKIEDIDKIIENYVELNNLEHIDIFIQIKDYKGELSKYKDNFRLLGEFESISTNYSSVINKYFSNIWKDKATSLKDLKRLFENYKKFTKLFNDGFFSQNVFKFLEKSNDEIKSKIDELDLKSNELLQKTNNFKGNLLFCNCNLNEIDFEEYKKKNNESLKIIELLNRYRLIYNTFNENKLINFDEKANFESIDLINQLCVDLNEIYNDLEIARYEISFEDQIDNLNKIVENKDNFINLITLRNSIENRDNIIKKHFDKIWCGPNTEISLIKNKFEIDKSFTREYDRGVFSDKTVELINDGEHSFVNYKQNFIDLIDEIVIQINKISQNPIISNVFRNDLNDVEFDLISKNTSKVKDNIDSLRNKYNKIERNAPFNLDKITVYIKILSELIHSDYVNLLGENLDNLNTGDFSLDNLRNSIEELNELLNDYNDIQSTKSIIDKKFISKYFKDICNGYETSVSDLNKQLDYNKYYEDLFNDGFFNNKTDDAIKDNSKLDKLNELFVELETIIKNLFDLFEILDLIHEEKEININKPLDDVLESSVFLENNLNQLEDWIKFEKLSKNLDNDLCSDLVKAIHDDKIKPELLSKTFKYNFARNLFNEIKQNQEFISNEDIEKYINLDKEVIELNRLRVLNRYVASRMDMENMESTNPKSMKQYKAYNKFNDFELNDNENIGDVLNIASEYIKSIKPIFITTPSSTFKYLPQSHFDYVIFDDVNQIQNEMVITSLLRGDNMIVIGDSKQSDIGFINFVKDKFKTKSLKWCYDIKNASLCNNEILEYPNQNQKSSFEIMYVENSMYDQSSKVNELEAEKIVDLAINHVKEYGFDKTLGIIALTRAQRDYIIKILLEKLEELPDLVKYFNPLDSFYVKYIDDAYESRDVILTSLTYGFDDNNVLNVQFESKNKYIANKLMTKSLEKTIVLSSFKRNDIGVNKDLKSLFEYENNHEKDFELSLFEENVYNFLNDNNFSVKKQLVDFTVNNNSSIECEGKNFNKFKNVRDKFRLHNELLETLGWKSFHICCVDWIDGGIDYQDKLVDAINKDIEFENENENDDFIFDFENEDEITINELKVLL